MGRQILYNIHVVKRERYILSRLNTCTKDCIEALKNYQFAAATTALYSFFMYDFCDLYLELVKPVFSPTSQHNEEQKRLVKASLYTVLEQYLRLLHPFMPYLTEELWQRLPFLEQLDINESIMLTNYPKPLIEWEDPQVEKDMELIKEAIHAARSLRAEYKIPNHSQASFYFRTESEAIKNIVLDQASDFCTLARGKHLYFLESSAEIPKGYCVSVVNDQLSLLVDLTGLIDVDVEITRLKKEIDRITPSIKSYQQKMAAKDYENKVPEEVRKTNSDKLSSFQAELDATMEALKMFESMKL